MYDIRRSRIFTPFDECALSNKVEVSVLMKLITFVVPCYNSAAYMRHCITTLLECGNEEEMEILLIDDGSIDETPAIADAYAADYPRLIRVIHQENGGHGEGVNRGIEQAQGLYMKVVDSDDWLDVPSAKSLISRIRTHQIERVTVDLYICNYVYEHTSDQTQRVIRYTGTLPEDCVFSWEETNIFKPWQYLLMHTLIFRTQVLRDSGLRLPSHTFYVDNLLAYIPLPHVSSMYYMDRDLYRYFIGRQDQSVNESVMVKRVDQQLRVTRQMIARYRGNVLRQIQPKCARYMRNYLVMMMVICSVLLLIDGSEEAMRKREDLWQFLQESNMEWYAHIRFRSIAFFMCLPGVWGQRSGIGLYRTANRIFKFN